jgi:hypothetical protein
MPPSLIQRELPFASLGGGIWPETVSRKPKRRISDG